jgi:predicted transposase YdaD
MHEYDTAFKLTLQHVDVTFRELLGTPITRWHNIEFPEVRSARADLLGETETGELVHIELQSSNDSTMALRMLQYYVDVLRTLKRYPTQILLYVGDARMNMQTMLHGPRLDYSYRLVDVRDLDGERLLTSERVDDNIVALLARVGDQRQATRLVLQRIAALEAGERRSALDRLLILAGLRKALEKVIEEEVEKVPILDDIRDHPLFGREYRRGLEEGRQEGREEGREEGRQEGELMMLRRQLEKRFGSVPASVAERLAKLSAKELEELSLRLLDARSMEDLLK